MHYKKYIHCDMRNRFRILSMSILKAIVGIIPKSKKKNINILVLSYFNLGDVICDVPSIRAIRKQWPGAKIHVLMRRLSGVEMISKCPYVDSAEVITSDLDDWKKYIKQLIHLKRMNFDLSFQLVRSFTQYRKTNIPYVIGVPKRYGLVDQKDEELYKHCFTKYAYVEGRTSRKEESIKVVLLSEINKVDSETECWISDQIDLKYKKLQNPYIVVHPGATLEYKCWPEEKFISLINFLEKQYGYPIYVSGIKSENILLRSIKNGVSDNIHFMIDLPIYEFWSLLKHSSLIITNDTGTLHFALALKSNVISLFGPTFPDYAIGTDFPTNCIIIRGTTHNCDKQNCEVYKRAKEERKKKISHLCENENIVCTDMISLEIVKYFADKILTGDIDSVKDIHNFQGYDPFHKV